MAMASFADYRKEAQTLAGRAGKVIDAGGLMICGYLKPARLGVFALVAGKRIKLYCSPQYSLQRCVSSGF